MKLHTLIQGKKNMSHTVCKFHNSDLKFIGKLCVEAMEIKASASQGRLNGLKAGLTCLPMGL